MSESIIEKVARAIHDEKFRSPISGRVDMYPWDSMSESWKADAKAVARAAIEAMREPSEEFLSTVALAYDIRPQDWAEIIALAQTS